ncbi:hypothetical protein ACRAWD_06020 [Caulobacter segnis]
MGRRRHSVPEKYVVISCGNQETSEALRPSRPPPRRRRQSSSTRARSASATRSSTGTTTGLIRTNADGAVDWKLVTAPETATGKDRAGEDWIAHQPGRLISGTMAFKRWFVRLEKVDALNRVTVTAATEDGKGGTEHAIAFDEAAYARAVAGRRLRVRHRQSALRLQLDDHAPAVVRLRHGHAPAALPQNQGNPLRPRSGPVRDPPPERQGQRRDRGTDLHP